MAKKKTTRRKKTQPAIENEVLLYIYALLLIAMSIIGLLEVGVVGSFLTQCAKYLVGNVYAVLYVLLLVLAVILMKDKTWKKIGMKYAIGVFLLFAAVLILCAVPANETLLGMDVLNAFTTHSKAIMAGEISPGGGIIGALLYSLSSLLFERLGTYIIVALMVLLGLLLVISKETMDKIKGFFGRRGDSFKQSIGEAKESRRIARAEKKRLKEEEKVKSEPLTFINYDEEKDEEKEEAFVEETVEDYTDMLPRKETKPSKFLHIDAIATAEKDVLEKEPLSFEREEELLHKQVESNVPKMDTDASTMTKKTDAAAGSRFLTDFSNYRLPSIRLLSSGERKGKSNANVSSASERGKKLVQILKEYGINTTLVDTHIGPVVTKFELRLENGVRVNRISGLDKEIKMGLAVVNVRVEAPIPGKSTVGVEIPNEEKTMVGMRDLMRNIPKQMESKKLLFALGKDLMGQCIYGELNKMPHLLIAGATGNGKSVCVNTIICSILMRAKPDEVKLLLIDPKKVEFTQYANIPHLMCPVVTGANEASNALKKIVAMMDSRYDVFSKVGVRNIAGYNSYLENHPEESLKPMPYIVVIIDELADLMLVAAKEVEASIQRITQLARAAGIHLIVATQRPSVNVITGVIKANIPSRIAFAVSSAVDSRTILDEAGAEKLLGPGDMLYMPAGEQGATRIQGCYLSDEEIAAIANYCSAQSLPRFEDDFLRLDGEAMQSGSDMEINDPMYEEVKAFVVAEQKASTSLLQRRFGFGYNRAARLIDNLQMEGIIGPSRGSKPREVFVQPTSEEE